MIDNEKTKDQLLIELKELKLKCAQITAEHEQLEIYLKLRSKIFSILNENNAIKEAFYNVINTIKTDLEFDAVGIRLLESGDFPYFVQTGFSSDFLLTENSLVEMDKTGNICRDVNGDVNLECTCGIVLTGKTDPSNSLFTIDGSAWTNDSKTILDIPSDHDPRNNPRNKCIHSGYNSIAWIPIKINNAIIGLLQLNDRKHNRFTIEIINSLEAICSSIGLDLRRKQAEHLLIESEKNHKYLASQFESILDHIPGLVFYKDKHNNFIRVNKYVADAYNKDKKELEGVNLLSLYPKDDAEKYYQDDLSVINSGLAKLNIEESWKTPEGIKWVNTSKIPFIDSNGEINGVIGISFDITKKKDAENKLRENEKHLQLIYNIIETGIVIINSENQTIIDINRAGAELIGLPENEIIGKVCYEYICPNNDDNCPNNDLHNDFENCENILRTNSGEIRNILKSIYPIQYKGMNCFIESFIDVSELKAKENELKQMNEDLYINKQLMEENLFKNNILVEELSATKEILERINSEKDKFFSIIAHDLKSPFSGFLGITKMMSENINEFTLQDLQKISSSMQTSAVNLYKLLENLLEWASMQRGLVSFNPENCNLLFLIKQIISVQTEVAKQKQIEFINVATENDNVFADVPMLNTILRNLVSNAIKFTPRGGKIEIGTIPHTHFLEFVSDGDICIFVKDSGIGMPIDMIEKLFKLDEKVSRPGTENEPSSGLGLLLCKEFVEKHGGKIWVESQVEVGSTFYFTLKV